jgi:hypothetical protein
MAHVQRCGLLHTPTRHTRPCAAHLLFDLLVHELARLLDAVHMDADVVQGLVLLLHLLLHERLVADAAGAGGAGAAVRAPALLRVVRAAARAGFVAGCGPRA